MAYREEILKQDYRSVTLNIQKFIAEKVNEAEAQGGVIGLSGGLDSSVAAFLAARALNANRLLGLILPDHRVTPPSDVKDAELVAKMLGIRYHLIDIAPIHHAYCEHLPKDRLAEGNLRARIRMTLLYYYANLENRLVIGTGDRSEALIGYFTKYGDGGVDIQPLGSLYKCQVRALAKWLGLPPQITEKRSSPRLWRDQEAEAELGLSYDVIDQILYLLFDKGVSEEEASKKFGSRQVLKVLSRYKKTTHKRAVPPIFEMPA